MTILQWVRYRWKLHQILTRDKQAVKKIVECECCKRKKHKDVNDG